jgi:hypothetical protein
MEAASLASVAVSRTACSACAGAGDPDVLEDVVDIAERDL